jgi:hypothetical protein
MKYKEFDEQTIQRVWSNAEKTIQIWFRNNTKFDDTWKIQQKDGTKKIIRFGPIENLVSMAKNKVITELETKIPELKKELEELEKKKQEKLKAFENGEIKLSAVNTLKKKITYKKNEIEQMNKLHDFSDETEYKKYVTKRFYFFREIVISDYVREKTNFKINKFHIVIKSILDWAELSKILRCFNEKTSEPLKWTKQHIMYDGLDEDLEIAANA